MMSKEKEKKIDRKFPTLEEYRDAEARAREIVDMGLYKAGQKIMTSIYEGTFHVLGEE